jgi:hypothetical protein
MKNSKALRAHIDKKIDSVDVGVMKYTEGHPALEELAVRLRTFKGYL